MRTALIMSIALNLILLIALASTSAKLAVLDEMWQMIKRGWIIDPPDDPEEKG